MPYCDVMGAPLPERGEPPTVLLVESNPTDADLLLEPLHETTESTYLANSGDEALDFLHNHGDYSDSPQPNLLLLSTGLPTNTTAEDVLRAMAETENLRGIPTVVLGDNTKAENVRRAYDLRANAYIKKPTQRDALRETAETITDFWIWANELPSKIEEGSHPADT